MSIEAIKKELTALLPHERRQVQAFLVALEDSIDAAHRTKLTRKIDKRAEDFATLEELDKRLSTAPGGKS